MSDYSTASAIVVGGSIGGLIMALLLRDLGFRVDVYERTATPLDGRGSGIVLQPDTVRWFVERSAQDLAELHSSTSYVQYLDRNGDIVHREKATWTYTSWGTFYRALLADFGTEHYHYGEYACGFSQDDDQATVRFVSGATASADLVVFADGITSVARERFDPDAALTYSGYLGWRGTLPLSRLSAQARDTLHDAVTYDVIPHSHILMYPIPGEDGLGPQHMLMNYVWYRNVPAGADLTEMLVDKRGVAGSVSVHPGQVQDRYVDQLRQDAADLLAPAVAEAVQATEKPYLQVLSDVRSTRMALGQVALIGDAACASRPHAAAGTAKAAADAWTLAGALRESGGDIPSALTKWEPAQLQLSDNLLRRVVDMGERAQFHNTWIPGDPDLRFGPLLGHVVSRQPSVVVGTGGEIRAVHEPHVNSRQVPGESDIADQRGQRRAPMRPADHHGMTGPPCVAGARHPGIAGSMQCLAHRVRGDVGGVDGSEYRRVGRQLFGGNQSGAHRGGKPRRPIGDRDRPCRCGRLDDRRTQHDQDIGAAALRQCTHRSPQPLTLSRKHFRHPHASAGTSRQHNSHRAHDKHSATASARGVRQTRLERSRRPRGTRLTEICATNHRSYD